MLSQIGIRSYALFGSKVPTVQRVASITVSRGMTTIVDTIKGKESVEEDRFIRERDMEALEKLKAKKQAALLAASADQAKAMHEEVVAPTMTIVENLLKETGDKISPKGLEKIARWKLEL